MESRRSTGFARPRLGVQPNRGLRRRLFSPRGGQGLMAARRRAAMVPIGRTPHIPNPAEFFRNVHQGDEEFTNNDVVSDSENIPVAGREEEEDVPGEELQGAGGQTIAGEAVARKKRRQRVVVSTGISTRPNLKKTVVSAKDFIKMAERDASEISTHQICATKKRNSWNQLLERAQTLLCSMERASKLKEFKPQDLHVFETLEKVNESLQQRITKFEQKLEAERKGLKLGRTVGSRKRTCCLVCHNRT